MGTTPTPLMISLIIKHLRLHWADRCAATKFDPHFTDGEVKAARG